MDDLREADVVVSETDRGRFVQEVRAGGHVVVADEPEALGGDDLGPSPYQLLLASLGSCTAMTVRMYADRKGWPLQRVKVYLSHDKVHARDCEECESRAGRIDRIQRIVEAQGPIGVL